MLERAGHEVIGEEAGGRQAIEKAPTSAPEVLLLDLNMPDVDGLEALTTLRGALPDTKIFILTTGQARDERGRALELGADGFIVKPERVMALPGELQTALDDSGD